MLPLLINNKAIVVFFEGSNYFPIFKGYYSAQTFQQDYPGEVKYRELQKKWTNDNSENWIILPPYPFGPYEDITVSGNRMFEPPSRLHWFGTDHTGRDVFSRLCYAFNISVTFGLIVTIILTITGVFAGGIMG